MKTLKTALGMAALFVVFGCAADSLESAAKNMARIVGITINGQLAAVLFVTNRGVVTPISASRCAVTEGCVELVTRMNHEGKSLLMRFQSVPEAEPSESAGVAFGTALQQIRAEE